jgi:hypothetical protein
MSRFPRYLLPVFVFALGVGVACGGGAADDGPALSNAEACEMIIEACHPKDDGRDPMINGCHTTAHDGGDCTADFDACVAACNDAPSVYPETTGESGNGSTSAEPTSDSADDGATSGTTSETTGSAESSTGAATQCDLHCDCMVEYCQEIPGNPYTSREDCMATCEAFDDAELACYGMWCQSIVGTPALADHLCEHAWGDFGTDKC